MLIGYARVSTDNQDTALQRRALRAAGCRRIVEETKSGGNLDRPALAQLLDALSPGDCLMVYKLDRLARSVFDLGAVLQRVEAAGASFRSLTEPVETATPMGRLVVQLLGVIAEFELALIRERCAAGRAAARARGVRFGRPRGFDHEKARALRASGMPWAEVATTVGAPLRTVQSALYRSCEK